MNFDLSIVIPTYKRPTSLERAVASAISSTRKKIEIIIIDDSIDGEAYPISKKYKTVYLNKGGVKRGLSRSRNLGARLAESDLILFLDDDDYLIQGAVDILLEQQNPRLKFVIGEYCLEKDRAITKNSRTELNLEHLNIVNSIPVGSYIVAKDIALKGFDELMRSHEDWDFLLRNLSQQNYSFIQEPIVVINKDEMEGTRMQNRRQPYFWLDFLSIYSRHPNPTLAAARAEMLQRLGMSISEELLKFNDKI